MARYRKNPEGHCRKCSAPGARRIDTVTKGKSYITYICRGCENERINKYLDRKKKIVYEHYGNRCSCCEEGNEKFLTIDHVNNDGYNELTETGKNRIGGRWLCQRIVSRGFPDTYQILCMNCNFGKRMNNGVCPHAEQ